MCKRKKGESMVVVIIISEIDYNRSIVYKCKEMDVDLNIEEKTRLVFDTCTHLILFVES